jgi:hypothetical protein
MTRDDAGGAGDPFQDRLASIGRLTVDTAHLQNISAYLSTLAGGVENDLLPRLEDAHHLATLGGDPKNGQATQRSALGALDSDFQEAQHLATNEQGSYQALQASLTTFAKDLNDWAAAMQIISDKYKTVDQRNGLGLDAWNQALDSGSGSGG